ncbi:MAG: hypothetical protein ACP5D7_10800 [Limnospira sp.]
MKIILKDKLLGKVEDLKGHNGICQKVNSRTPLKSQPYETQSEASEGRDIATSSKPPWMKFAGIFENDADFEEIMNSIQAERDSDDESEVDPSFYL